MFHFCYDSQPIPSLSPSNLCGSGGNTVNLFCGISLQSKSGGECGIQKSGYEGVLRRKSITISSVLHIGKESNGLEESEVLGVSKNDTLEYVNYQKKIREIIRKLTLEKALTIGISRRMFFYLKTKTKVKKSINLKEKTLERLSHCM